MLAQERSQAVQVIDRRLGSATETPSASTPGIERRAPGIERQASSASRRDRDPIAWREQAGIAALAERITWPPGRSATGALPKSPPTPSDRDRLRVRPKPH
jgi:hypothetical protein